MDVVRGFHTGKCRAIRFSSNLPDIPKAIAKMLEKLSKVPAWIQESKRSACWQGAMRALALCKIYNPSFEPADLVAGFPAMRSDGQPFTREDYQQVMREVRVHATSMVDDINVERFELGYDEQG